MTRFAYVLDKIRCCWESAAVMAANAPPRPPGDLTINIGTVPPGKFLDAETARRTLSLLAPSHANGDPQC